LPAAGQSWEIAELGYRGGTLYNHFLAGNLANANLVPSGAPDDGAAALAWDFNSAAGEVRNVEVTVSESAIFASMLLPRRRGTRPGNLTHRPSGMPGLPHW